MATGMGAAATLKPPPKTPTRSLYPPIPRPSLKLLPSPRTPSLCLNPLSSSLLAITTTNADTRRFTPSASRRRRGRSTVCVEDSNSDSGGDGWSSAEEGEEEEEEEGELLPFQEMRRWERNKPTGFGEGKTYDTSVEEKLLEEMERARAAQLADDKKTRSSSRSTEGPKKKNQNDIAPTNVSRGTQVRLSNLPKKKNIHRDLQMAFKGFPGIIKISPAVIGNHKTRDPICKGFAFLELESEEAAHRFVQMYSKQNVLFGKIQKDISCEVINPCDTSSSPVQVVDNTQTWSPRLTNFQGEASARSGIDHSVEESMLLGNETDGKEYEHLNASPLTNVENGSTAQEDTVGSNNSIPLPQNQKKQKADLKKKKVRTKSVKDSKLGLPSSVARLKTGERTVLTGVFSKYGGKAPSTLVEDR